MRPIPKKLRAKLSLNPAYKHCLRFNDDCSGRITWEHCFSYAGRQINEEWAIIPLCCYHHLGPGLDKKFNRWAALQRATPAELAKYPREWDQQINFLNKIYGK